MSVYVHPRCMAGSSAGVTCDWHGCTREATNSVRRDLPSRSGGFTSLFWVRCAVHTPECAA